MSKRKSRSSAPNIPSETLERARRQAAGEDVSTDAPPAAPVSSSGKSREQRRAEMRGSTTRRGSYTMTSAATGASPRPYAKRKREELTAEEIDERLRHPDKFVSEEQLRSEYSYVVRDIRSMFILAAGLFATLVVLGVALG